MLATIAIAALTSVATHGATLAIVRYRARRAARALAAAKVALDLAHERELAEQRIAAEQRARIARDAKVASDAAKRAARELAERKARVKPYAAPARGRYVWANGETQTWVA